MIDGAELEARVKTAIGYEPPSDAFGARGYLTHMITTPEAGRVRAVRRHEWVLGFVAAALAVALVATLLFGSRLGHVMSPTPAVHPKAGMQPVAINFASFFSESDAVVRTGGEGYITHDGGRTWLPAPLDYMFGSWQWIDAQHFYSWGLSEMGPKYGGQGFLETSDGGVHWRWLQVQFDPTMSFFLTPNDGWTLQWGCEHAPSFGGIPPAAGAPCIVYRTTDAGASWSETQLPLEASFDPAAGIAFADSLHGFTGASSRDGIGRIFATDDGGGSWRAVTLPAPPGGWFGGFNAAYPPRTFGSRGILLDQEENGRWWVYSTSDRGATWSNPRLLPFTGSVGLGNFGFGTVPSFVSPTQWWGVDAQGNVLRTIDGGASWQKVDVIVAGGLRLDSVVPAGGKVLWGIASSPTSRFAVRSTNGGATWAQVLLPAP